MIPSIILFISDNGIQMQVSKFKFYLLFVCYAVKNAIISSLYLFTFCDIFLEIPAVLHLDESLFTNDTVNL